MSDLIRLLPESIANHIAAGEVAPSPSYVVKELLENAVDADATHIRLEIMGGGRDMIAVTDNGKGMSPQDARMAFERHATSKLNKVEDLERILTFGFRGEALAAISAISQVEMQTRERGESIGSNISISGGHIESVGPCTTQEGTIIKVRNIFFNTPARRKFLKDASKEEKDIKREFDRVALIHPEISFSYISQNKNIIDLNSTSLLNRIVGLTSARISKELLPIKFESEAFSFHGYIGTPIASKQRRFVHQYFFANGRYIEHKYFSNQIKAAFQGLIPADKWPHYFIYFEVPPQDLDINIHPTKIQVRFAQEYIIGEYLRRLIKDALTSNAIIPTIDFENTKSIDNIPVYIGQNNISPETLPTYISQSEETIKQGYTKYNKHEKKHSTPKITLGPSNWEKRTKEFESFSFDKYNIEQKESPQEASSLISDLYNSEVNPQEQIISQQYRDLFIYDNKYIVLPLKKGITLIHIKRAQQRILYDKYVKDLNLVIDQGSEQHTIEPQKIQFDFDHIDIAQKTLKILTSYGFDFGDLGGGTFSVLATPFCLKDIDCISLIMDIVHNAFDIDDINTISIEHIALMVCHRETNVNIHFTVQQAEDLIADLFASRGAHLSPDGQKIMTILSENELNKLFL